MLGEEILLVMALATGYLPDENDDNDDAKVNKPWWT